jgi:hypothetical protein
MIKIIQRTTDNKYLKSVETQTWVDDVNEAFEMTYKECEDAKLSLEGVFLPTQLKEIVNMKKDKPMTKEEKKEIINLLKNK